MLHEFLSSRDNSLALSPVSSSYAGALLWRHNGHGGISNHQPHDCLLNRSFRRRSKKTSKLHVTGLCEGNSPMTGEFPSQRASNAENVSISWRHHSYMNPYPSGINHSHWSNGYAPQCHQVTLGNMGKIGGLPEHNKPGYTGIEIRTWARNYIHIGFLTHPCQLRFDGSLFKPPLKLGYGSATTPYT